MNHSPIFPPKKTKIKEKLPKRELSDGVNQHILLLRVGTLENKPRSVESSPDSKILPSSSDKKNDGRNKYQKSKDILVFKGFVGFGVL